jgi:para-aminobenzoate synthetase component 1
MAYSTLRSYKLRLKPLEILAAIRHQRNCFFLDSSLPSSTLGRYSFLGFDPFYTLETKDKEPFSRLRSLLGRYRISLPKIPLPFLGGAVGYLAYDLGFLLEKKLKRKNPDDLGIPDSFFGFYNTIIIVDKIKKYLHIFAIGFPETNSRLGAVLCRANIARIEKLLSTYPSVQRRLGAAKRPDADLKSNFKKEDYLLAIRNAKEYIRQGDIYQVNLSQRFSCSAKGLDAFGVYGRLREISPVPFAAYFDAGSFQILSSSPERFLAVKDKDVVTRPMKGTRPRGENRVEDLFMRKELLRSVKDKAELVMIVDLLRNDLGKVCDYESVRVDSLRNLERYSTVYQTTSTVKGDLYKNKDMIDLLRACFPGGSITGCPKIRAMEIIEELEPNRRSIYTGSLGYLSFSAKMDFNILIRTILKKGDELYFGVGGGIVADSVPEKEYLETLIKAKALIQAIS